MNAFDIAAVLVTLAALFGYLNFRLLRLPPTIGILTVALASSLLMLLSDQLVPRWHLRESLNGFLVGIDFNQALMHGMLCFLLFAGSLHLQLEDLAARKWTIAALAILGVALSTLVVAGVTYLVFGWLGIPVPFSVCLVFGALISPTDPIATLGLLKQMGARKDMEAIIAGESLFNDGVGVVAFLGLTALAGLAGNSEHLDLDSLSLLVLFLREVVGGVLLGLGMGYGAYRALKSINYRELELLITLALVMAMYSLSFKLEVSGPIAVVVAGLFIGNHGKKFAMSRVTVEHVDAFWGMMDEILNSVLFLLIGLEVFAAPFQGTSFLAGALAIPLVLVSRFLSVAVPITAGGWFRKWQGGVIGILTWGGLRGGISVAMVLSLPAFEQKDLLLHCTYGVVLFSILVQGLTLKSFITRFGWAK